MVCRYALAPESRAEPCYSSPSRRRHRLNPRHPELPVNTYPVVELLGDGISSELSASVHSIVDALPFDLEFQAVDLSDGNRRKQGP